MIKKMARLGLATSLATAGLAVAAPLSASAYPTGWTCDNATLSASHRTANQVCHRKGSPPTLAFRVVAYCTKGNPGIGPWRYADEISSGTCPTSRADVTSTYVQFR